MEYANAINDYYPVELDVKEMNSTGSHELKKTSDDIQEASAAEMSSLFDADHLLKQGLESNLTEFQMIALLLKNAFEGHVCFVNKLPIEKLAESGTVQLNLKSENMVDWVTDFSQNYELYRDGLERCWIDLVKTRPDSEGVDFYLVTQFLLSAQLFKLPVSMLSAYNLESFRKPGERKSNLFQLNHQVNLYAQKCLALFSLIETVDEEYSEKFRDMLVKLEAKEKLINQLITKLMYANDPAITSADELERKYFDYVVAANISESERKKQKRSFEYAEFNAVRNEGTHPLEPKIKRLYRAISRNCSEVHINPESLGENNLLGKCFMLASGVYNDFLNDSASLFLQYNRLITILVKVLNYRKVNELPLVFSDYTGYFENQLLLKICEKDVAIYNQAFQKKIADKKALHMTDLKIKHVTDPEIAEIHHHYLTRHVEYCERVIGEINDEINAVMAAKTNREKKSKDKYVLNALNNR